MQHAVRKDGLITDWQWACHGVLPIPGYVVVQLQLQHCLVI